jgi:molybdopterin/thiamine biosynthesis adenylyltransferase
MSSITEISRELLAKRSVLLAGAGNIGTHVVPLLARAGVGLVRIVDRDTVEARNLKTQDFRPEEVGRAKAEVLAEHLRACFPDVTSEAYVGDLEDLPLGLFDVDVLLGGLDSRRARQVLISEMAWPLGIPVVDGGVGEGLIGRVQVFQPGPETACLECTWGQNDYRELAAEYPCNPGESAQAPATISTAFLGNLVGSLMACECLRLLGGQPLPQSYEVPFDLWQHALRRFELRRNRRCRHDHEVVARRINLSNHAAAPRVDDLLDGVMQEFGSTPVQLEVRRRIGSRTELGATRFLRPHSLQDQRQSALASLGFVPGDLIRARGPQGSVWFEVGKAR